MKSVTIQDGHCAQQRKVGNNMSNAKEFDVVFLGATGFTGQLVVEYVFNNYGLDSDFKWAIAGRNQNKLENIARKVAGDDANQIPMIITDTNDETSVTELVQRTKVVCTTVGPYAMYGNELVKACAINGTHYCDLTGEVQWMRRMIDLYETTAQSTGARIVHTCGFDSIPSDLGVHFAQSQMKKVHGLYANEVKCRIGKTKGGMSGGTVASMMNMMEEMKTDPSLKVLLADPYSLNPVNTPPGSDTQDQVGALYDLDFKQWTAPFVMAAINTRVVRRSNALMNFIYGNDFKYSESMLVGNGPSGYMKAMAVAGVSALMALVSAFDPTRSLAKPMLPAPGEGPSKETIETGFFNIELLAKGQNADGKRASVRIEVTGDKDPGYGATCKMLAESAICLAKDELETEGGIWTPASAMGDVLIQRLQKNAGMTFECVAVSPG
jgi:short subunit dehydrogenase-like uncharacterized protein